MAARLGSIPTRGTAGLRSSVSARMRNIRMDVPSASMQKAPPVVTTSSSSVPPGLGKYLGDQDWASTLRNVLGAHPEG